MPKGDSQHRAAKITMAIAHGGIARAGDINAIRTCARKTLFNSHCMSSCDDTLYQSRKGRVLINLAFAGMRMGEVWRHEGLVV